MRLSRLLAALPDVTVTGERDPEVTAVTYDSRAVSTGAVFVAVTGFTVDGHAYLDDARRRGAAAVVVERGRGGPPRGWDATACVWIEAGSTRVALSALAAAIQGFPGHDLRVAGVTGTDGKTTTSHMLAAVLAPLGPTGMIGTARFKFGDEWEANPSRQTTLEATDVQALLARMRAAGLATAVLEASSHGLALHKLDHAGFDAAVFTNITEDHLDFHQTQSAYWQAKARLLALTEASKKPGPRFAVLNADDASFGYLTAATSLGVISYGIDQLADVRATIVEATAAGTRCVLDGRWGQQEALVPVPGAYNVLNALAAVATGLGFGMTLADVCAPLARFAGVPGRMERVDLDQPFTVIIDYAHTGHAFRKLLAVLRPLTSGRIIAVFGSAGEQSPERREGMGRAAAEGAGLSVLTTEDPRHEDPLAVIGDIAAAMLRAGRQEGREFIRVSDRGEAIAVAMATARPGDVVVLAGKGHEQSIIVGDEKQPWDERSAAEAALHRLGYHR